MAVNIRRRIITGVIKSGKSIDSQLLRSILLSNFKSNLKNMWSLCNSQMISFSISQIFLLEDNSNNSDNILCFVDRSIYL